MLLGIVAGCSSALAALSVPWLLSDNDDTADCRPHPLGDSGVREALVEPGRDSAAARLDIEGVWFSLGGDGWDVSVSLAIYFDGEIPAGHRLAIASTPTRSTYDAEGNRGSGLDFYNDEYVFSGGRCNVFAEHSVGYSGAAGLTYQYHVLLVDDAGLEEIGRARNADGYSQKGIDIAGLGVSGQAVEIATFDIATGS